mmetsp:Transcript_29622/g.95071  ORF Transcript_29622/g.95071 Transcript_29622/m.95071 type:complete len:234 (-) Transcript_29622:2101-2802(-)
MAKTQKGRSSKSFSPTPSREIETIDFIGIRGNNPVKMRFGELPPPPSAQEDVRGVQGDVRGVLEEQAALHDDEDQLGGGHVQEDIEARGDDDTVPFEWEPGSAPCVDGRPAVDVGIRGAARGACVPVPLDGQDEGARADVGCAAAREAHHAPVVCLEDAARHTVDLDRQRRLPCHEEPGAAHGDEGPARSGALAWRDARDDGRGRLHIGERVGRRHGLRAPVGGWPAPHGVAH